jgi:hypothetical protein
MTKQHKATPKQWSNHEIKTDIDGYSSCIVELRELRARVELLEATQHAHIDTSRPSRLSDEERDQIRQDLANPARVFAAALAQSEPTEQDVAELAGDVEFMQLPQEESTRSSFLLEFTRQALARWGSPANTINQED